MVAMVLQLRPRERIWLDPVRIGELYSQFGGVEVRALLDRAMGELARVRQDLDRHYHSANLTAFARALRQIRLIADHLGLLTMARVARDVADCLERGDSTALAATWARLSRSAEQALAGGWDI